MAPYCTSSIKQGARMLSLIAEGSSAVSLCRVQLNQAQDEIMRKKELLEDLQPDSTQNGTGLLLYMQIIAMGFA